MDELENADVSALGQELPQTDYQQDVLENQRPDIPPRSYPALHNGSPVRASRLENSGSRYTAGILQGLTQISTSSTTFKPPLPRDRVALPTRPILKRDASDPQIQIHSPIDIDALDSPRDPPDSLTLAELRKIRDGFPIAPGGKQSLPELDCAYDFEYDDPRNFGLEIEEWFGYSMREVARINALPTAFEATWSAWATTVDEDPGAAWGESTMQESFVRHILKAIDEEENLTEGLACLCYLILGIFRETAGEKEPFPFRKLFLNPIEAPTTRGWESAGVQMRTMVDCGIIVFRNGGIGSLLKALKKISDHDIGVSLKLSTDTTGASRTFDENSTSDELWTCFTILHTLFEVARLGGDTNDANIIRTEMATYGPELLLTFTNIVAAIRWDEAAPIPISKIFLLHWKATLLAFGSLEKVEATKRVFREKGEETDERGHPVITASPLDYHLFRQEMSSKYPAFVPPQPSFPFEPDNNTILPPLRHRQSTYEARYAASRGEAGSTGNGSIMHQPVHIATPAPSPPPSPAGPGGKGGKKQNYQTNQMFPFLYPPLDMSSNELGGRGSTELQDALVGRKWEGSDIPASILEAAELFAKRMRATRAMKQLWKARVDFMKQERGWRDEEDKDVAGDFQLDPDDGVNGAEEATHTNANGRANQSEENREEADKEHTDPLDKVADYYDKALPVLQSFVIVSLKAVLKHVTDLVTLNGLRNSYANSLSETGEPLNNRGPLDSTLDQVDTMRMQEVTNKALTGSLILLLKWFKVSHILRYEYLTQLLLDSNYIPMVLKLWQSLDVSRACHHKLDRPEYNFFALCGSGPAPRWPAPQSSASLSSLDSTAPPPVTRHRRSSSASGLRSRSPSPSPEDLDPPEIDELGYPLGNFPTTPLRNFSWRNIFSLQNHLRVLQKLTRRKAHRSLLLVSYKSSQHLRKTLRVPVPQLRLYTLKLFKSQVPYCGRKWRQSNMKTITAVWLSVPAELRDDWLVGGGGGMGGAGPGDLDGTVDEALPLEQSLRALTWWWNERTHGDGGQRAQAPGFFERELERMGEWGGDEDEEAQQQQAEEWGAR